MQGIIYKATNKINGKIYIGQTNDYKNRISKHYCDSFTYKKNGVFNRALRKYGKDNFIWEIIDIVNIRNELSKKEIYWINKLKSNNKKIGYNIDEGGFSGPVMYGKNNPRYINLPDKEIIKLYNNGYSLFFLTKKYDVSITKIKNILNINKIKIRNISESKNMMFKNKIKDKIIDIIKDYKNEMSLQELELKYKIWYRNLVKILKENNITIIKCRHIGKNHYAYIKISNKKIKQIIKKYKNGESLTKLGKLFNVSWKKIKKILVENNICIRNCKEATQLYFKGE